MTGLDKIVLNEVMNDGNSIYLYPNEESRCYKAYGYSAYLLSSLATLNSHAEFSSEYQMPCVSMTDSEFMIMSQSSDISIKHDRGSYICKIASYVDEHRYLIWTQCLRLKRLLSVTDSVLIDSNLSLAIIRSLSNINISMYRLVTTCGLDDELGARLHYSHRCRDLFKLLEVKLSLSKTLTNRAHIILAMYNLNHGSSFVYDSVCDEVCDKAVRTLYQHASRSLIPISDLESALVCQCIARYLYYINDYDGEQSSMRGFFDKNITLWNSHDWVCDFSPRVIMARIGAMVSNSDMFMDSRFDENISALTNYLCKKMNQLMADERIELYSLVSDKGSPSYHPSAAERLLKFDYPANSRYEFQYMKIDSMCRLIENSCL